MGACKWLCNRDYKSYFLNRAFTLHVYSLAQEVANGHINGIVVLCRCGCSFGCGIHLCLLLRKVGNEQKSF